MGYSRAQICSTEKERETGAIYGACINEERRKRNVAQDKKKCGNVETIKPGGTNKMSLDMWQVEMDEKL